MKIRFSHLSILDRRDAAVSERVEHGLDRGRTPEQSADRMRHEGAHGQVRQETIYGHIHSDEGRKSEVFRYEDALVSEWLRRSL